MPLVFELTNYYIYREARNPHNGSTENGSTAYGSIFCQSSPHVVTPYKYRPDENLWNYPDNGSIFAGQNRKTIKRLMKLFTALNSTTYFCEIWQAFKSNSKLIVLISTMVTP